MFGYENPEYIDMYKVHYSDNCEKSEHYIDMKFVTTYMHIMTMCIEKKLSIYDYYLLVNIKEIPMDFCHSLLHTTILGDAIREDYHGPIYHKKYNSNGEVCYDKELIKHCFDEITLIPLYGLGLVLKPKYWSELTNLTHLSVARENVDNLDISVFRHLVDVEITSCNVLKELDLSKNESIKRLKLQDCGLLSLSLPKSIECLNCKFNNLTSIENLESCTKLFKIDVRRNKLTYLNLSHCSIKHVNTLYNAVNLPYIRSNKQNQLKVYDLPIFTGLTTMISTDAQGRVYDRTNGGYYRSISYKNTVILK